MEVILQTGNFLVQGAIVYGGWVQGSRTLGVGTGKDSFMFEKTSTAEIKGR